MSVDALWRGIVYFIIWSHSLQAKINTSPLVWMYLYTFLSTQYLSWFCEIAIIINYGNYWKLWTIIYFLLSMTFGFPDQNCYRPLTDCIYMKGCEWVVMFLCHLWPYITYITYGFHRHIYPDSKVHGANVGPIWGRQDPDGPHVCAMNFAIWVNEHIIISIKNDINYA